MKPIRYTLSLAFVLTSISALADMSGALPKEVCYQPNPISGFGRPLTLGFSGGQEKNLLNINYSYAYCISDDVPVGLTYKFKLQPEKVNTVMDLGDHEARSLATTDPDVSRLVFLKKAKDKPSELDFFIEFVNTSQQSAKIIYCKNSVAIGKESAQCDRANAELPFDELYQKVTRIKSKLDEKETLIEVMRLAKSKIP